MANFTIRTDLLKLKGAFVTTINGKTQAKKCLVIPIDDAELYEGKSGIYLNMTAIEMRERKYEDTHCIKQMIASDKYKAMSEDERIKIPIIGGLHETIIKENCNTAVGSTFQSNNVQSYIQTSVDEAPF